MRTTPIKSPSHKRSKGEEGAVEDLTAIAAPAWAASLKTEILAGVRGVIQEEMQTVRADVQQLQTQVGKVENTATQALQVAETAKQMTTELRGDVTKMIDDKLGKCAAKPPDQTETAVFGGLGSLSFEAADEWIRRKMRELNLAEPTDIYHKGFEFNGVVCAKYPNAQTSQQVVQKMQRVPATVGEKTIRCKLDRPFEARTQLSFLLGLRRQLIMWETFTKGDVRVNEEELTMSIGRMPVLSTSIHDGILKLNWIDKSWSEWTELQECTELKQLIDTANDKLSKVAAMHIKGKGKGPLAAGIVS